MSKRMKRIVIAIPTVLIAVFLILAMFFFYAKGMFDKGNGRAYDLNTVVAVESSPMKGNHLAFLGSSVTVGATFDEISFVEFLATHNTFTYQKEAVSGTTLVDSDESSYIQRMLRNISATESFDAFICQLSTNDASKRLPLGEVSNSYTLDDFDTSTVAGAMEYIICYATQTWDCPVIFFTNTFYESSEYDQMVDILLALQDKWQIGVIDLWNNQAMRAVTPAQFDLYMHDEIHPTKAGYLNWWLPAMEEYLYTYLGK